jgi:hypothetical protein
MIGAKLEEIVCLDDIDPVRVENVAPRAFNSKFNSFQYAVVGNERIGRQTEF